MFGFCVGNCDFIILPLPLCWFSLNSSETVGKSCKPGIL